jgi:hypothetical protein
MNGACSRSAYERRPGSISEPLGGVLAAEVDGSAEDQDLGTTTGLRNQRSAEVNAAKSLVLLVSLDIDLPHSLPFLVPGAPQADAPNSLYVKLELGPL